MSISHSAVIVELNLSVWGASRIDKDATIKLTIDNNATVDAARVQKNLMAGSTLRKEIADYAAGCRLWHNNHTLPWADKGARLLPTSLFLDYKSEANVRRDYFEKKVGIFLTNYPQLVQIAGNYLGDLFNADDYPDVSEVRSKFGFRLVFSPVPEAGDFRLDIPAQDLEEVKGEYDAAFDERVSEAMRTPWEQLHKLLTGMSEKLKDADGEDKKRYHDSFVTNAHTLCGMLTHLNITADPKLEQARRDLERAMMGVDITAIREDAAARADTKKRLDEVLKAYEW